jgi:hypothetical protein
MDTLNIEKDSYGSSIKGDYRRPILPEKVSQVGRFNVQVEPESTIHGGILCNDLEFNGTPFEVRGSVMAQGSVKIALTRRRGTVLGPLVAGNNILVDKQHDQGVFRVAGDLSSKRMNIENGFCYGNIFGVNVNLKNCVVLGSIHASQHLTMEGVVCFTFLSDQVKLKADNYLLNYAASANSGFDLEGNLFVISSLPWMEDIDSSQLNILGISVQDLKQIDAEKADGNTETVRMASIFDRVVDLTPSQEQLAYNITWVENTIIDLNTCNFDEEKCKAFEGRFRNLLANP